MLPSSFIESNFSSKADYEASLTLPSAERAVAEQAASSRAAASTMVVNIEVVRLPELNTGKHPAPAKIETLTVASVEQWAQEMVDWSAFVRLQSLSLAGALGPDPAAASLLLEDVLHAPPPRLKCLKLESNMLASLPG